MISSIFLIFIFSLASANTVQAQRNDNTVSMGDPIISTSAGYSFWSLIVGSGSGYGVYRDLGTAPFRYKGLFIQPDFGLEFRPSHSLWAFSLVGTTSVGLFENAPEPDYNFNAFDITNTFRIKAIKYINRYWDINIFIGAALTNFLDVTVNPNYENAAAGVSDFAGPEIIARGEKDFGYSNWKCHAEMGLMPFAAVLRPGYAYIDNYTATQPVSASILDNYEWNLKPLAGLSTDIGFDVATGPGSRISFSYCWTYYSSGNSGYWRFDHVRHMLLIDFVINLVTKRECIVIE
ncbi:MAG: hypothetical protein J5848_05140 [Bacteroidales bacterium]|nr:hypothetical protein [Bacteroidales bacterium]